ncbi:MAG: DUF4249 domain-containing protein [Spirosomataceae bacterium]
MKKKLYYLIGALIVGVLLVESCIVPFAPPEVASADRFLVVDGFLNTGGKDSSRIQLGYTQVVSNKNTFLTELKATVTVEGDKGSTFTFTEIGKGLYRLAPRTFNEAEQFRVRVKTVGKKEYVSDYEAVKQTPPIESITYKIADDKSGVYFYVNSQDPLNKTGYYRWRFEETYEYHTPFFSSFEVKNKEIVDRLVSINRCWKTEKPATILLASTTKLSKDVVREFPIVFVPATSGKLIDKYSILVKQIGLTAAGFEYWNALSKTTETTGSLFDPQPSQVTGNVKCVTNPQELVFGFFSAYTPQEKRIFVAPYLGVSRTCMNGDTLSAADAIKSTDLIITEYLPEGARVPKYLMASPDCLDCRLGGGTIVRPTFWQ